MNALITDIKIKRNLVNEQQYGKLIQLTSHRNFSHFDDNSLVHTVGKVIVLTEELLCGIVFCICLSSHLSHVA
ncbi:hypothetical protein T06_8555 [Trichinella sp. T6]|nr:hypothetical protein T06_8555 [Trichinella sp. T6]